MEEIEINQKCEKEMIYCGKMEKRERERSTGKGRVMGSSEEEISCFLMGADYISS